MDIYSFEDGEELQVTIKEKIIYAGNENDDKSLSKSSTNSNTSESSAFQKSLDKISEQTKFLLVLKKLQYWAKTKTCIPSLTDLVNSVDNLTLFWTEKKKEGN